MAGLLLYALLNRTLAGLKPVLSNAEGNDLSTTDAADTDRVLDAILQRNNQTPDTEP